MELRWIANLSASALHAADAIVRGRTVTDPRLSADLATAALALNQEIADSPVAPDALWHQLLTWAHHFDNNRELAVTAIRKVVAWKDQYDWLSQCIAGHITAIEGAVQRAIPGIVNELDSRSRPIREQWEARGPGLLHAIRQLTDKRLLVDHADVVLVLPAVGGGGAAHWSNNSVRFEAVLTNNVPQLPEVTRLAWLLAQLNYDLPFLSELIPAERLPRIAQLALLPPTLQTAHDMELTAFNPQTTALAMEYWLPDRSPSEITCETLLLWWQTYQESYPKWTTALVALDRML